ncbi:hypothetical protein INT45_011236 [Circinella minor]|uniref:Retrotransposon gag domain-containing protein n=1 Tax=Circinella minor TaxID=1195481 RepID=A0A8H7RSK7_9FUNG|nr:hypothetical protein INT45_011236 [Circinella minor]
MSLPNGQDNTNNNIAAQENRRVDGEGDVNMEMGRLSITEQNEFQGSTWDEIRVKIMEQFDKPEQRLKSMKAVLHMRQRHGEKVKTYAKTFHQRCIESGLDKYPKVKVVALLSSLEKKNDVYGLVVTKFSSDIWKQSMNDMVNYVAGLQLDSTENEKRSREDDAGTTHPN